MFEWSTYVVGLGVGLSRSRPIILSFTSICCISVILPLINASKPPESLNWKHGSKVNIQEKFVLQDWSCEVPTKHDIHFQLITWVTKANLQTITTFVIMRVLKMRKHLICSRNLCLHSTLCQQHKWETQGEVWLWNRAHALLVLHAISQILANMEGRRKILSKEQGNPSFKIFIVDR